MKQDGQFLLFTREELQDWLFKTVIHRKVILVQNHHTWSPAYHDFNGSNYFNLLKGMKAYQMGPPDNMSDIAQHFTTFPDGLCAVCRPLDRDPAGIRGANTGGICIENLGNFDAGYDQMTAEHRTSIIFLNTLLCKKFNLAVNTNTIVYHHWYDLDTAKRTNGTGNVKSCPGTAFFGGSKVENAQNNFIPLIVSALTSIGPSASEAAPTKG
jgi:hypothetical protein